MLEPHEKLRLTLKNAGYSLTAPRKTVFTALLGKEPQLMHELIVACANHIDRASVYRTTMLFEQLGIVQRLQMGWKYKLELSDAFAHHHHHLSCRNCGKTFALAEDTVLERRIYALAARHHFAGLDHQLEIHGICATCSAAHLTT